LTTFWIINLITHNIFDLETIHIRKTLKIKLPDAIILSTSLVHNLELITRNVDDFKNVPGLKVINPFYFIICKTNMVLYAASQKI
jgi:hypothetical protein